MKKLELLNQTDIENINLKAIIDEEIAKDVENYTLLLCAKKDIELKEQNTSLKELKKSYMKEIKLKKLLFKYKDSTLYLFSGISLIILGFLGLYNMLENNETRNILIGIFLLIIGIFSLTKGIKGTIIKRKIKKNFDTYQN